MGPVGILVTVCDHRLYSLSNLVGQRSASHLELLVFDETLKNILVIFIYFWSEDQNQTHELLDQGFWHALSFGSLVQGVKID